jgi:hypothetical protein
VCFSRLVKDPSQEARDQVLIWQSVQPLKQHLTPQTSTLLKLVTMPDMHMAPCSQFVPELSINHLWRRSSPA